MMRNMGKGKKQRSLSLIMSKIDFTCFILSVRLNLCVSVQGHCTKTERPGLETKRSKWLKSPAGR